MNESTIGEKLTELVSIHVVEVPAEYVEIYIRTNSPRGGFCLLEWFPNGSERHDLDESNVRMVNPHRIDEAEAYKQFAVIVGRIVTKP